MGMDITVGFDRSPFESGGPLGPEVRIRVMREMALAAIKAISKRTEKGIDVHGKKFKNYSKSYYKWKKGKGRMPQTEGDWLYYTGQMLASMTIIKVDADHFVIGFTGMRPQHESGWGEGPRKRGKGESNKSIANALLAWINNQTREFFALSEDEQALAVEQALAQAQQEGLI